MSSSCNSLLAPLAEQGLTFEFVIEPSPWQTETLTCGFRGAIAGQELAEHVWIYLFASHKRDSARFSCWFCPSSAC